MPTTELPDGPVDIRCHCADEPPLEEIKLFRTYQCSRCKRHRRPKPCGHQSSA